MMRMSLQGCNFYFLFEEHRFFGVFFFGIKLRVIYLCGVER